MLANSHVMSRPICTRFPVETKRGAVFDGFARIILKFMDETDICPGTRLFGQRESEGQDAGRTIPLWYCSEHTRLELCNHK